MDDNPPECLAVRHGLELVGQGVEGDLATHHGPYGAARDEVQDLRVDPLPDRTRQKLKPVTPLTAAGWFT